MLYEPKKWPSWYYHHTCPEGEIFECEEDVPPGWVSNPAELKTQAKDKGICSHEGCERKAYAKGLCTTHYAKSRKQIRRDDAV